MVRTARTPLGDAPPPSGTRFDIIIVGGGTIGLSAAYYAAFRGLSTLLLEQYSKFAHPHASSAGHSRFFRIMHSSADMAKLAEIAFTLWHEIEVASNRRILKPQPLLFYGLSGQTVEGDLGEMTRILANLGVPYQWYDSKELAKEFPVFKAKALPNRYVGLVQPNSAVIRTQESIAAFYDLAKKEGATLVPNQRATVTPSKGVYRVTCHPAETYYIAPNVILASSAWTNRVLDSFGIQLNLCIWQMTVAYFRARVSQFKYPFWYEFGSTGQSKTTARMSRTCVDPQTTQDLFYGFPPDEKPGYIKASADFTHSFYSDPGLCTHQPDPKILSQLGAFLQTRFHGVSPKPIDCATCLYTMSGDFQMVLDRLPRHPNVAIFTGDSGRGFKFTPLFGRVLVDLATIGSTSYDISPFSIHRPGIIR